MYTFQIFHIHVIFKALQVLFFMHIKNVDSLVAIDDLKKKSNMAAVQGP